MTFPTLYDKAVPGTEEMQLYDFRPKDKIRGSVIILQGLGARNVEFLLWMGTHLASAGINAILPVLPGNFTRIENGRTYGTPYLWPDYDIMYNAYQHAVVDILSTIDYVEQQGRWKQNNCMVGYCLGGMLATIVAALDDRINQKIFMTTGGHIPQLMFESVSTNFVRRMVLEGQVNDEILNDKQRLYQIYDDEIPRVREMSLEEIINSQDIHPLFKVDPLSYAHLL
ncbi:MAG TPA: dienelactone hydrolase family protein, partial [Clostridia bacterium]|nr:dienelactone hydrolase family protein [Clostridia bacterium]